VEKKAHTVKNLVITDSKNLIVYISNTVSGRIHDKKLADSLDSKKNLLLNGDLGFWGFKHDKIKIKMPHKKPKGKELTEEQKAENKQHSSSRVKIEHVFAHLKTIRILKDKLRNYKLNFNHLIMEIGAKLYNFKTIHNQALS